MTERGKKLLSDILLAIDPVNEFLIETSGFEDYQNASKTKNAVERRLGIIGEAVNKFEKLESDHPLFNARLIIDFRNRLIHFYDNLDDAIVWVILKKHIPILHKEAQSLFDEN